MSKNIEMLDVKMNDAVPDIKDATVFIGTAVYCQWNVSFGLNLFKNSLLIYAFYFIFLMIFGPSILLQRNDSVGINLDVSTDL